MPQYGCFLIFLQIYLATVLERFEIHLTNPTGAQLGSRKEGQVTILDDEANDTFRAWLEPHINYVLESDGAAEVRVRLAGQHEYDITMILRTDSGGSATVGEDYEYYSRTFTFAPYETEKIIHINILDDRKKEAPEFIETVLSATSGAEVHLSGDDAFTNIWIGDDDHKKAIQSTTSDTEVDLRKRHFQVAEGATDSYHVWLTRRPTEPVTIRLNPLRRPPGPRPSRRTAPTPSTPTTGSSPTSSPSRPARTTIAPTDTGTSGRRWRPRTPFFKDHTPGYVWANEMDDDPGDEPTVIESETHSGVNNGITATVAYAPHRHR